jgi:hypothetical protein
MARGSPLRLLPVALLAALALLLAACGAGTSSRAQPQDSVRNALDVRLDRYAVTVGADGCWTARRAGCDGSHESRGRRRTHRATE